MNEMILDKLVQKISNLLTDVNDVNLLIRGLKPSQEVLTATLFRLDAIQGVLKEIEAILKAKNVQLAAIETQLKQVPAAMADLQKTVAELPAKFGVSPAAIKELKSVMLRLSDQLLQPQKQEVVHRHLVKPIAITAAGYFIAVVLAIVLVNFWSKNDLDKGRDLRYRWLQAAEISGTDIVLHYADSLYLSDPLKFEPETIDLESEQKRMYYPGRSYRTLEDLREIEKMYKNEGKN